MFKTGYINNNDLLYSPLNGLSIYNKVMYTEFADDCADIFFKLLHKYNVQYGIFSGNSIGYIRCQKNMHWVDVLVFNNSNIDLITYELLHKNRFYKKNRKRSGGFQIYSWNFTNEEGYFSVMFLIPLLINTV